MAPLAGKPPYATDLPDSYYNQPPQPRQPRAAPNVNANSRSSAYDVYDSYLNRNSGMDAVGLGFLNGDMDDEDEDDVVDKHRALAEALNPEKTRSPPKTLSPPLTASPSPPPQYIAAPKPGYAAPIAALSLASPEPAHARQAPPYSSPSPVSVSTPHPLDPPLSPITPAFARPRPAKTDVSFAVPEKPIIRGDSEETLLPRRGERGDDFWRRFSMVAREESRLSPTQKQSAWLRKTQDGSNRLARWVWVVGIILILAAAAGIGFGWYFSHNSPPNQQPDAIGGSADQKGGTSSSSLPTVGSSTPTAGVMTSLHVSPTNTVARRVFEPRYTSFPVHRRSNKH